MIRGLGCMSVLLRAQVSGQGQPGSAPAGSCLAAAHRQSQAAGAAQQLLLGLAGSRKGASDPSVKTYCTATTHLQRVEQEKTPKGTKLRQPDFRRRCCSSGAAIDAKLETVESSAGRWSVGAHAAGVCVGLLRPDEAGLLRAFEKELCVVSCLA